MDNMNMTMAKNTVDSANLMSMGGMSGMNMNMSMMSISWNSHCVVFLFDQFHARTSYQFMLGCFVVFAIVILGQVLALPFIKNFLTGVSSNNDQNQRNQQQIIIDSQRHKNQQNKQTNIQQFRLVSKLNKKKQLMLTQQIRLFLYFSLTSLINLLIMLLAMTMNGYVILTIVFGIGLAKTWTQLNQDREKQRFQQLKQHSPKQQIDNCCEI